MLFFVHYISVFRNCKGDFMFLERLLLLCERDNTDISNVLRALKLSTSKGTAWRNGSIPNGEILLKLASYFHVSTDYLLGNTNDPRPADGQKENPPTESQRILESVNSSENVDLLLHIIKNEASLTREQLLKLQGFVSALEAENK